MLLDVCFFFFPANKRDQRAQSPTFILQKTQNSRYVFSILPVVIKCEVVF